MKFLTITFLSLLLLGSVSCKKCINCSITWQNGISDTTTHYEEYCDKKSEIERYEANVKETSDNLDGSYKCE